MKMDAYNKKYPRFTLLVFITCVRCAGGDNIQPNILLVLADDYGWNDIGYHGSEIKTPHLDQLASRGVKLDNYYVQPICSPSRSQLLSGRYQIHTGLQHFVIVAPQANGLPTNLPTLADMLRAQGYATHLVGKWHLGFYKEEFMPTNRGFDSAYGYLTGNEDYYTHVRCMDYNISDRMTSQCGTDFRDNLDPIPGQKGQYSANLYADRTEKIVKDHVTQRPEKALFLYLPLQTVHYPLQVPDRYMTQYSHIKDKKRRTYAGMVSAMDETVHNVTQTFKKYSLWNNTVMIFSTDNGGALSAAGNNWPLRGGKNQLWEGGVRAVGFVTGPVLKAAGVTSQELIHISDWFPTLTHLAGGNTSSLALDGHDVWQTISQGKPSPRKELLHNIDPLAGKVGQRWTNTTFDNRVRAALRVGDWKILTGFVGPGHWVPPPHLSCLLPPPLPPPPPPPPKPVTYLRKSIKNMVQNPNQLHQQEHLFLEDAPMSSDNLDPNTKNIWLYNIRDDPLEKRDLTFSQPHKVIEMLERLARYNATAVTCRFPPYDPMSNPQLHGGVWGPWM